MGTVTNGEMLYVMRSLSSVGLLDSDLTSNLLDYIVKRGYDSDDLMAMSSQKGGYRRGLQLIWIAAETCPDLKNRHFLQHV